MKTQTLLIALLAGYLSAFSQDSETTFELEPEAVSNLQLEFAKVTRADIGQKLHAAGTVRLDEKQVYDVTPRIEGVIVADPTSLGDQVEEGDILFRIQSAELSEKISNYVTAEEAMTFAVAAADQERKLEEKNLSSAEQLRERELELRQAVAAHARALQPLRILDFDEQSIHAFLSGAEGSDYTNLDIRAIRPGEIVEKKTRLGAAVQQDQHLFTVADLSELWVEFQVALRDVDELSVGDPVLVESTVTEKSREAEIVYISPVADDVSRTVMVRATMENNDRRWRPGNPVSVSAVGRADGTASSIPASSVVDYGGGKAVFVRLDEKRFAVAPVQTGTSDGETTEIIEGLSGNETVVSRNAAQLKGHLEMTAE